MEVEEDTGKIEQNVRIVWRQRQRTTETFDRTLRVTFDSPEVADLIVDLWRLGFLEVIQVENTVKRHKTMNKVLAKFFFYIRVIHGRTKVGSFLEEK